MKNRDDEDRYGILNEKSECRIDGPPVSDGPLFVAAKKKEKKNHSQAKFIIVLRTQMEYLRLYFLILNKFFMIIVNK